MEEKSKTEHSAEKLIEALNWLSPEEQKIISGYRLSDILNITNLTDDEYKQFTDYVDKMMNEWQVYVNALSEIRQYYENPVPDSDKVVTAYEEMDVIERQKTAQKLMKNIQFNNSCCNMMGMAVAHLKNIAEPEKKSLGDLTQLYDRE